MLTQATQYAPSRRLLPLSAPVKATYMPPKETDVKCPEGTAVTESSPWPLIAAVVGGTLGYYSVPGRQLQATIAGAGVGCMAAGLALQLPRFTVGAAVGTVIPLAMIGQGTQEWRLLAMGGSAGLLLLEPRITPYVKPYFKERVCWKEPPPKRPADRPLDPEIEKPVILPPPLRDDEENADPPCWETLPFVTADNRVVVRYVGQGGEVKQPGDQVACGTKSYYTPEYPEAEVVPVVTEPRHETRSACAEILTATSPDGVRIEYYLSATGDGNTKQPGERILCGTRNQWIAQYAATPEVDDPLPPPPPEPKVISTGSIISITIDEDPVPADPIYDLTMWPTLPKAMCVLKDNAHASNGEWLQNTHYMNSGERKEIDDSVPCDELNKWMPMYWRHPLPDTIDATACTNTYMAKPTLSTLAGFNNCDTQDIMKFMVEVAIDVVAGVLSGGSFTAAKALTKMDRMRQAVEVALQIKDFVNSVQAAGSFEEWLASATARFAGERATFGAYEAILEMLSKSETVKNSPIDIYKAVGSAFF